MYSIILDFTFPGRHARIRGFVGISVDNGVSCAISPSGHNRIIIMWLGNIVFTLVFSVTPHASSLDLLSCHCESFGNKRTAREGMQKPQLL